MSSNFTGNPNNILPQSFIIPDDPEEKDLKIRQYLNDISTATNSKDSGLYDGVETVTGQRFLPTFSTDTGANATYRGVLRKVVDFGTLPNATSKTVAHGITFTSDLSGTRIYGAATSPGSSFIPIPFASPTLSSNISLTINATTINITTGINRTAFTRCFVVIEWISVV